MMTENIGHRKWSKKDAPKKKMPKKKIVFHAESQGKKTA
jgi:hypothetical protein